MKKLRYLILTALFILPIKVFATTINTDYDLSNCTLTVSGDFTGNNSHDVQVLVTKKDGETKGLKNTELNNNSYSTSFVITTDAEYLVDITVADQNGSGDTTEENITIPACELATQAGRITTLNDFDGNGHSITIKDATIGFDTHDRLDVEMMDLDSMNQFIEMYVGLPEYDAFVALRDSILEQLGEYKVFMAFTNVYVRDEHLQDIDYSNYDKGFILKIHIDKDVYKELPGLKAVYFDQENIKIGDVIETSYDEDNEVFILNISRPGQFILYLDNDYEFIDNTANPKYTLGSSNSLTLKINADLSKFKKLTIGGKEVTDFDKKSGSTIITLPSKYLNGLSEGNHEIIAYFSDGTAKTTLTIEKESVISKLLSPKTNDPLYIFIRLAIISFAGMSTVVVINKCKKKKYIS